MPATTINGSPNILLLDSNVTADGCSGKFYVDVTPSTITNAAAIPGVKIQIKDPYGEIIREYQNSYDITNPFTAIFQYDIPYIGQPGKYQYGKYTITCKLTDSDARQHTVSKVVDFCQFADVQEAFDCISMVSDCKNGYLHFRVAEPPVYQGKRYESKTQEWTIKYPSGGPTPEVTGQSHFSLNLYPGLYIASGQMCAAYNLGDRVYVKINYTGYAEKLVKCLLDMDCVNKRMQFYYDKLKSGCDSDKERSLINDKLVSAAVLIPMIQGAIDLGGDPTRYIDDLEAALECTCTCNCGAGVPVINGTPAANVNITGCNIGHTQTGNTHNYDIQNHTYKFDVTGGGNFFVPGAVTTNGCEKTLTGTFNIANLYAALKTLINSQAEYDYWGNIIKLGLNNLNVDCLGITRGDFDGGSLENYFQVINNKFCTGGISPCAGTVTINNDTPIVRNGANVTVNFVQTGCAYIRVLLDGVYYTEVLASAAQVTFIGKADGLQHTYTLIPVCTNGSFGTAYTNTFNLVACATIAPPSLSSNNIANATCPYDGTGLVQTLPAGITAEWHNANNTLPSTLVTPTALTTGVYWVFAKNAGGCYSIGSMVQVGCNTNTTVTAPQNLTFEPVSGGIMVRFESAQYPPPNNSYTLKRRLKSDPDVSGSYTTLGSTGAGITFNTGLSLFELLDGSAVDNTLYVYRAISNGGSNLYIDREYANIKCPTLALSHTGTTINAQFAPLSGSNISQVYFEAYDNTQTTLIASSSATPAFSNPISLNANVLAAGTYRVRVRIRIDTFTKECAFTTYIIAANTITGNSVLSNGLTSGSGTIVVNNPAGATLTMYTISTGGNANFHVQITTGPGSPYSLDSNVTSGITNGTNTTTQYLAQGTYNFTNTFSAATTSTGSMTISN